MYQSYNNHTPKLAIFGLLLFLPNRANLLYNQRETIGANPMKNPLFRRFCLLTTALALIISSGNAHPFAQQWYGDGPPIPLSEGEWPGTRVYTSDVNDDLMFCFSGDVHAFNAAMQKFASAELDDHFVVLRPGPGGITTLRRDRQVKYDWKLDIRPEDGLAAMWRKEQIETGALPSTYPRLTFYISKDTDLEALVILDTITVLNLEDLPEYWWIVDPFSDERLERQIDRLDSTSYQIQIDAVRGLAHFGHPARIATEALQKLLTSDNALLRESARETLEALERSGPVSDAEIEYRHNLNRIQEFQKPDRSF
jgi:hypothetical protein